MKTIRAWFQNRVQVKRRQLFEAMLADQQSGVAVMIQNRAMEMAMAMVMRWLEKKRIRHCAVCPGTETLRRIRDRFWCPRHFAEAENALKEHEARPVAAAL